MQPDRHDEPPGGPASYAAYVLDALGAADYALNLRTGVLRSSPRLNALYGYPADHPLTPADCQARVHPDDRADSAALGPAFIAGGESDFQREFRLQLPGGDVRWVVARGEVMYDAAGQPGGIRGVVVDISERKRAEAALRESEDRFRIMADTIPQIIWLTDAQGRTEFFNKRWTDYCGVPYEPSTAAEVAASFIHPDDAPQVMAAFGEAQRTGGTFEVEQRNRSAAGEYRWFLNRAEPYRDPHTGAIVRWFGVGVDIHDWKRAEAALRESEARYRSLLDSIDQGFCLFEMLYDPAGTPVDYRFLAVNRTFERHTGLRDAVGKTARELVPNLEAHWVEIYGRVAATGESLHFEQGSTAMGRWFEVEAVRVGEAGQHQVALIFTDISARKQADADARFLSDVSDQIRVSEDADQLLEAVARLLGHHLEVARCFFSEIDDQGDQWRVRHEYRQPASLPPLAGDYALSSFPAPVLAALRAGRNAHSDDTAQDEHTASHYATAYQPLGMRAFVAFPLRHNGRWVAGLSVSTETPHPWTPRELALLETVAERTWNAVEKLRLAAAQRAYAARLQLLNSASLLINAALTREAVLRLTADQARALIGAHQAITSTAADQPRSQALTAVSLSPKYAAWEAASPTDSADLAALIGRITTPLRLTEAELAAQPVWSSLASAITPPMRGWLAVPLVGRDRRNLGLIQLSDKLEGEFTTDDEALLVQLAQVAAIALENQHLYAQEQAARAEAEEASRLKDEFLATVSHELRTPLTAFLGYAELLQRRQRDETYVTRTVEKMVQSARAQAALVEDLLDVSRIVSGKIRIQSEPIDLTDVIHAAVDTVRPTVEAKGLQVQVELDQAARAVLGDANRLQQVVWNLLANATKFTPAGGHIAVRLGTAGSAAELIVSDSGQGIHPDFLPYVFDRFRQADSSSQRTHSGLGLGLAIVRHLVELHGGTVHATSDGVDQGATFTVRLPLVGAHGRAGQAGAAIPADAAAPPDESLPLRGRRVLVVDDQPPILDLLTEILVADGATVQTCSSAQEALATIRAWQPDVLVSDIAMPDADGYWLIQQVRSLPPGAGREIPAVALTAYVRMEDRLRVLAAGFQQYVPKPVDAAELRSVVRLLVAGEVDG